MLGIINRDGCLADFVCLPTSNLHLVPDSLSDSEAAFCEPLAAAYRIIEQGLPLSGSEVCVVGDGKLGLLCSQVLASHSSERDIRVTVIGRHQSKISLVSGLHDSYVLSSGEPIPDKLKGKFHLVVEATGSSGGILSALQLTRPMGHLVLKTTVSSTWSTEKGVLFADLCNDIVVNEKTLVGSRCGPMDRALEFMNEKAEVRDLLNKIVHNHRFSIEEGVEALETASRNGVMKVQVIFSE